MRKSGILNVNNVDTWKSHRLLSVIRTGLGHIVLVGLLSSCGDTALIVSPLELADDDPTGLPQNGGEGAQELESTPDQEVLDQNLANTDVQEPAGTPDASLGEALLADGSDVQDPLRDVLSIMAVGDSITHGFAGATSYRKPLIELLQSSGCRFEMVGSMTQNLPESDFVSPHEGYSGHRTDAFLTGQQSSFGNNQGINASMVEYSPELILLHLGTNDMNQDRDIDNVLANIDQIVALIFDAEPQAHVVVSTLVPYFRSTDPEQPVNRKLDMLSDAIEAWVAQSGNTQVHLIDIREGFNEPMMLPDLIHPGELGDAHLAERFHESIIANELCS